MMKAKKTEKLSLSERYREKVLRKIEEKGGRLESDSQAISCKTLLTIYCEKLNQDSEPHGLFRITGNDVLHGRGTGYVEGGPRLGSWCKKCKGETLNLQHRADWDEFVLELKKLGWKLNQERPESWNQKTKIKTLCEFGHENNKTMDHYRRGHGCDGGSCNKKGRGEEIVRLIFENLFGAKFPKRQVPNSMLQFDGYSEAHKIAFEYDGLQHRNGEYFGKRKDLSIEEIQEIKRKNLEDNRRRDLEKERLCIASGIQLIRVPYDPKLNWTNEAWFKYIKEILIAAGFEFHDNKLIGLDVIAKTVQSKDVNRIRLAEKAYGIKCSDGLTFRGSDYLYKWHCKKCMEGTFTAALWALGRRKLMCRNCYDEIRTGKPRPVSKKVEQRCFDKLKDKCLQVNLKLLTPEWRGAFEFYEVQCQQCLKVKTYKFNSLQRPRSCKH
jgi:hypothetical protein